MTLPALVALVCALTPGLTLAAGLVSGAATINYSKQGWDSLAGDIGAPQPVLVLAAFLDQSEANSFTLNETLAITQDNPQYQRQTYTMNDPVVTNLQGRSTQPTTFEYTPGALTNHTGRIGLGGLTRFRASTGGSLLYGDFTLQFEEARVARGGTGWYLRGNIPPAAPAFDLLNVSIAETPGSFTIQGDLGISFEVANFLYATPSDALRNVGSFVFTGYTGTRQSTVPVINRWAYSNGQLVLEGTNGIAGGTFSVIAANALDAQLITWTVMATGTFDSTGWFSATIATTTNSTAQFHAIKSP